MELIPKKKTSNGQKKQLDGTEIYFQTFPENAKLFCCPIGQTVDLIQTLVN